MLFTLSIFTTYLFRLMTGLISSKLIKDFLRLSEKLSHIKLDFFLVWEHLLGVWIY